MAKVEKGKCFTLISAASIQPFVFASNVLRENAGASHLVWAALEDWKERHPDCCLYVGGGNAALSFSSREEARSRVFDWSREWLERAPDLRFAVAHQEIEGLISDGYIDYIDVLQRLEGNNDSVPFGSFPGALPIQRECQSTGRGASLFEKQSKLYLSEASFRKRRANRDALDRLKQNYDVATYGYDYPSEFENIGVQEGSSHIGIVCADGDGIGKLFHQAVLNSENGAVADKLNTLSELVTAVGSAAFNEALRDLRLALPALEAQKILRLTYSDEGAKFFPLRPIIYGGDDLVFICHGKIALWLAVFYLRHFERIAEEKGQHWTSSAGVLIMPAKFPFSRGYQLVKELMKSAKKSRKNAAGPDRSAAWLDFQILLEGAAGSLRNIRETLYPSIGRPYCLGDGAGEHRWQTFSELWNHFHNKWPRSRAKRYLDSLTRGGQALAETDLAFRSAGVELPPPRSDGREASAGEKWDALEFLDFHIEWPEVAPHE